MMPVKISEHVLLFHIVHNHNVRRELAFLLLAKLRQNNKTPFLSFFYIVIFKVK